MKVRFEQVELKATLGLKCGKCGKKYQRTLAVMNTVSPFNRHPDGGPVKTRDEVAKDVTAKLRVAVAAEKISPLCRGCR